MDERERDWVQKIFCARPVSKEKAVDAAFAYARAVTRRSSSSYSLGIALFPRDIRKAMYALYAFFRSADDLVDTREPDPLALRRFRTGWEQAAASGTSENPILCAAAYVFRKYEIPDEVPRAFFASMEMDLAVRRYNTFADLLRYMYGSAGVIGVAMAHIIGFAGGGETLSLAQKLGYAFQLTNMLRDIKEDYFELGRVYLPHDELARWGITDAFLKEGKSTPEWRGFMAEQVLRARVLHAEGAEVIGCFSQSARAGVRLMHRISCGVLDEIERADYDIFTRRARIPGWKKAQLLLSVVVSEGWARLSS